MGLARRLFLLLVTVAGVRRFCDHRQQRNGAATTIDADGHQGSRGRHHDHLRGRQARVDAPVWRVRECGARLRSRHAPPHSDAKLRRHGSPRGGRGCWRGRPLVDLHRRQYRVGGEGVLGVRRVGRSASRLTMTRFATLARAN